MRIPMKWLIIGGVVVAGVGLYLGYDAAMAALLAPLLGRGSRNQHVEKAEQAKTGGEIYREMAEAKIDEAEAHVEEAEAYHEQQEVVTEDNEADETISIDKVVDDAKKDWN